MILPAMFLGVTLFSVPVHLAPAHPEATNCSGVLRAERTDGALASATLRRESAHLALELAPGEWNLMLDSPNCWSPILPITVMESTDQAAVSFAVWQAAAFTGALTVRPGDTLPGSVEAEFRPAGQTRSRRDSCALEDGRWRCGGPKVATDVKISAPGFAPVYFWAVGGERRTTTLPSALLERGASIIGWIQNRDRTAAADAEIEVAADNFAAQSNVRFAVAAGSAKSGARGFFQVAGLPPGRYAIRARTSKKDSSLAQTLDLAEEREYVVGDIRLEPPATVDVEIDPARAPDGEPWRVALDRMTMNGLIVAQPTPASADGRWTDERVERGAYLLKVVNARGSVVQRLDLDVEGDLLPLRVVIGEVRVEGRVRAGEEALAAALRFDSAKGSVEMRSDDDGRFEGWLPAEGKWRVQITPREVLVRVRMEVDVKVPPNESTAVVDLDLPGGKIRGLVETREGEPVPDAVILATRGKKPVANAATGPDGSFSMLGITEGEVDLVAKRGRREESREVHYNASREPATVVLVLESRARIVGSVRVTNGSPVVGALIRYLANGILRSTVSDPSGDFELDVPPSISLVDVVVLAPGLPVKIARLRIDDPGHDLVVNEQAGILRIRPRKTDTSLPVLRYGPTALPLNHLLMPAEGFGLREADGDAIRLTLEPGTYSVCYPQSPSCVTRTVVTGAVVDIDGTDQPMKDGGP